MLIPALALLSTTAMAADLKFNAEGRFDYVNGKVKHESVTSTNNYEEKVGGFESNVLRLNAVATINENLSFRMRYRFSTNTATANRDLTFDNLDFFYVDHKTPWFTARLGKQNNTEMLGREYFMSGTDYPVTLTKATTGTTGYTTDNTTVYNLVAADLGLYRTGASLMFTQLEGQVFTLNVSEPMKVTTNVDTAGVTNSSKNTSLAYGIYYNGTFFNKMFQPTLGYTMAKLDPETGTAAANTVEATYKLMAAGFRSEVAGFVIDADWKEYKRPNHAVVNATSNEDKTSSIWANVAYTWDMLTPFVNYQHDKFNVAATDTTDFKRDAISVGLQIKPFKDNNFRYHVAYTNDVKKIDGATTATADKKVTANVIAAGIKFDL